VEVLAIAGAMALKLQRSHPIDQKTKKTYKNPKTKTTIQ
jgi:hypothetical protein